MPVIIKRRQSETTGAFLTNTPAILQRLLCNRGVTQPDELDLTTSSLPKPNFANLPKAVDILCSAIVEQKKIMVIGDFDADGATSTALSCIAFKLLGAKQIDFLVPNRFDFGYGLSPEIVDVAAQDKAEVIMTVDNGISCIAGVERAQQHGIEVVITDHHLPGENLPDAGAIINPNLLDCDFPSKNLAGVGVAFYLMSALRARLRQMNWFEQQNVPVPNIAELLDLVALGTIADVVSLDHCNRILVQQGINRIRQGYCRPGIKALLDVAQRDHRFLVSSDFGFALGPRLNAAGRLDDMSLGISCLMAEDYSNAIMLASRLDELNKERREIEMGMQQEALDSLDELAIQGSETGLCLFDETWHQGVIGIVAGRIKERFYRPTVVFAQGDNGELKGSCRSIKGFHIRDALEYIDTRNPELILKFGGHAMAAGLSIKEDNYPVFKQAFESAVSDLIEPEYLENVVWSDGALNAGEFTIEMANYLKQAMPWGQNFEAPVFDDEFIVINERVLKDKHLKLVLQHKNGMSYDGIWFNYDQSFWQSQRMHKITVAFTLDSNTFRGKTNLQLMIKAIESSSC